MRSSLHLPQAGMTLVEMVIAIGIYTALMLAVFNSVVNLYDYNSYTIEQADEVESARIGMTAWNRDSKEMTVAEDGTYPVAVIEPHRFGYYSDTDQDANVEYIEYVLATTTITKYIYEPTGDPLTYNLVTPTSQRILSRYVRNIEQGTSTFMYFDNNGTQLSSTSPILDVRYVRAQIIVNIDPNKNPGEFMLRSSVAPRNLKDNL